MGGDCIGSSLVGLSTGYDFVNSVIDVALGHRPAPYDAESALSRAAAVRFVFSQADLDVLEELKLKHPEWVELEIMEDGLGSEITDSSSRYGYYIFSADELTDLVEYLPSSCDDLNL